MAVFARSDVCAVSIPPSLGGCGQTHSRPVANGVPSKIFKLDCQPCEGYLSGARKPKILKVTPGDVANGIAPRQERVADADPHWSSVPENVPPTPDEQRADTHFRKTAQLQIEMMNALGTAIANGLSIPPEMMHFLKKGLPAETISAIAGTMLCPQGHDNPSGAKFCGECAAPMTHNPAIEPAAVEAQIPLASLHVATLRKMCRERGLPDKGSKEEFIARLEAA